MTRWGNFVYRHPLSALLVVVLPFVWTVTLAGILLCACASNNSQVIFGGHATNGVPIIAGTGGAPTTLSSGSGDVDTKGFSGLLPKTRAGWIVLAIVGAFVGGLVIYYLWTHKALVAGILAKLGI